MFSIELFLFFPNRLNIIMTNLMLKKKLEIIDYEGGIVVFAHMLGSNQKAIDPLFTRRPHKGLDVSIIFSSAKKNNRKEQHKFFV